MNMNDGKARKHPKQHKNRIFNPLAHAHRLFKEPLMHIEHRNGRSCLQSKVGFFHESSFNWSCRVENHVYKVPWWYNEHYDWSRSLILNIWTEKDISYSNSFMPGTFQIPGYKKSFLDRFIMTECLPFYNEIHVRVLWHLYWLLNLQLCIFYTGLQSLKFSLILLFLA